MAKGNLLLGMGRGKLGDIVLYRQNGQQMSRPRTRVVKNPRTSGQQIQRMIQATIAYGYAGLKTIVDHSFEGVQYGQRSMSYFMKRNMDALRAQVIAGSNGASINARFAVPNVRVLYPNEYIVSNGSLPPFTSNVVFHTGDAFITFGNTVKADATVADVMQSLGLSAGDQLTFLFMNYKGSSVVAELNGEKAFPIALAVRRLKIKDSLTSEELQSRWNGTNGIDMEVSSLDFAVEPAYQETAPDSGIWTIGFNIPSLTDPEDQVIYVGACAIRSRKQGQSWLRSPETMVVNNVWISDDDNPIGFTLSTAYNAWMSGTTPVGVSEYILNGKPNSDIWPTVPDEDEP
jgi:hypothetical protein